MAGSWGHMTTGTGKFLNNENFHSMLDTGGDVYEAAEECYGMVWWLAARLAETQTAGRPTRGQLLDIIGQAREHYEEGLADGGVQRSR